ncbi:hypothetical protein PsorP6_008197 [Peronosclerospora sorghi]|uniref:Uncharacterized protein n=1 Tax=Peronosclerospora sorghi TaxID=230839 RepID=A0ACC0WCU3_9STRA|nr:hypothetical protein PsorP6_008197 [Peronosclerospora sorghi]
MIRSVFRVRSAFMTQVRLSARAARSFSSYPPHEIVGLPSLSPTMEMGNMSKWNKKEGDAISAGDIVCEIETDKAVVDYEATDDMFLAKILIPDGTQNIPVGQPMMVVCDEEESIASFKNFKIEDTQTDPAAASPLEIEKSSKKEDMAVKSEINKAAVPQDNAGTSQPTKRADELTQTVAPTDKAIPSSTPSPAVSAVFEKWGFGMKKSAISTSLIKKQQAYIALYGITGMTPLELPSKK